MRRNIILCSFYLLFSIYFCFSESNVVIVKIPNVISETESKDIYRTFYIDTDDKGIISRIHSLKDKKDSDDVFISIIENEIVITKDNGKTVNRIIVLENGISIVGPHFTRKRTDFMNVRIEPEQGIIYDSDEITLAAIDKVTLIEKFKKKPSDFFAYRYSNGTMYVDYKKENNINFKYVFTKAGEIMHITFFYPGEDDDYTKYSPDIIIEKDIIRSSKTIVNVINYFILKTCDRDLSVVLFPGLFI